MGDIAFFAGSIFGGALITALLGWPIIRLGKTPKTVGFFLAWVIACIIAAWGMHGEGGGLLRLASAFAAYGIGAWLNYKLAMRAEAREAQVADFE